MYVPCGFTPEQEQALLEAQVTTQEQLTRVISWQKTEEERRKWTLLIGGIGLLFAALKLGILVIPSVRERSAKMGRL